MDRNGVSGVHLPRIYLFCLSSVRHDEEFIKYMCDNGYWRDYKPPKGKLKMGSGHAGIRTNRRRRRSPSPGAPDLPDFQVTVSADEELDITVNTIKREGWYAYTGDTVETSNFIAVASLRLSTSSGAILWDRELYHHVRVVHRTVAGTHVVFLLCTCDSEMALSVTLNTDDAESVGAYVASCCRRDRPCKHVLFTQRLLKCVPSQMGVCYDLPFPTATFPRARFADAIWVQLPSPRKRKLFFVFDADDATGRRIVSVLRATKCTCPERSPCKHVALLEKDDAMEE